MLASYAAGRLFAMNKAYGPGISNRDPALALSHYCLFVRFYVSLCSFANSHPRSLVISTIWMLLALCGVYNAMEVLAEHGRFIDGCLIEIGLKVKCGCMENIDRSLGI